MNKYPRDTFIHLFVRSSGLPIVYGFTLSVKYVYTRTGKRIYFFFTRKHYCCLFNPFESKRKNKCIYIQSLQTHWFKGKLRGRPFLYTLIYFFYFCYRIKGNKFLSHPDNFSNLNIIHSHIDHNTATVSLSSGNTYVFNANIVSPRMVFIL